MSITLTEAAATRVKSQVTRRQVELAEANSPLPGLLLSIKKSGCSGLAYQLDYAHQMDDAMCVFESYGVKIMVASEHLEFLDGTEIDYIEEGLSAAFHFKNPNVTEQCGCGESFTVN